MDDICGNLPPLSIQADDISLDELSMDTYPISQFSNVNSKLKLEVEHAYIKLTSQKSFVVTCSSTDWVCLLFTCNLVCIICV